MGDLLIAFLLPTFPTQLSYFDFTELRTYQISHAPIPKAMTFPGRGDEEVPFSFLHSFVFSLYLSQMMIILFPCGFCLDGRAMFSVLSCLGFLCILNPRNT